MSTLTTAFYPIVAAMSTQGIPEPINNRQKFLCTFFGQEDVSKTMIPEMDVDVAGTGHSRTITSTMNLKMQWKQLGEEDIIHANGNIYSSIRMPDVNVYSSSIFPKQIFCIPLTGYDQAFIMVGSPPDDEFILMRILTSLYRKEDVRISERLSGDLLFPAIRVVDKYLIDWMVGMGFSPLGQSVQECEQRNFVETDILGVHIKSETVITVAWSSCSIPTTFITIVDKPFFFWIMRQGLKYPLFAGYFDYDCWVKGIEDK